jgi:hypothetical protein
VGESGLCVPHAGQTAAAGGISRLQVTQVGMAQA